MDKNSTQIAALAPFVIALAGVGTFIINYKNSKKDTITLDIAVKRANNSLLILQNTTQEFILFEVYNKSLASVVINQIGFKSKSQFINLVDIPSILILEDNLDALGGSPD